MECEVAIVILHYESVNDTRECLESLMKYVNGDKIEIIVVDNGSVNGKIDSIMSDYESVQQVHFIISEKNLGFAKGNNLGFIYAKKEFHPKVIVLANNDIVFRQRDFIVKLIEEEKKLKFDVAGPKIISLVDGMNQNPVGCIYNKVNEVSERIRKFKVLLLLSYIHLDVRLQKVFAKKVEEYRITDSDDFQLHGACMFFANNYLKKYNGLYDETFMYDEEYILKHIVRQNGMQMSYLDALVVHHKEGSSTESVWGKGVKKRRFFYKYNIESLMILRKMMLNDDRFIDKSSW